MVEEVQMFCWGVERGAICKAARGFGGISATVWDRGVGVL